MRKVIAIALAFLLLLVYCSALLDSDEDLVPDEQEIKDGTNPDDPNDNALAITITGDVVVGNTVVLSVEHKELGKIPDVDFTIKTKTRTINLNSGAQGEVSFKIEEAGAHYITAQKKRFSMMRYISPICSNDEKNVSMVPFVILLTGHFTNIVVALLAFIVFATLLRSYLIKSRHIANLFSGIGAFAIFFANYQFLFPMLPTERIIVQLSLLGELLGAISALAVLRMKKLTKKILREETKEAGEKKQGFSVASILQPISMRIRGIFALREAHKDASTKLEKMSALKEEINQTKMKLTGAIAEMQKLEHRGKAQEKMHAISQQIEKLHEGLYKAKAMKADVEQKEEKSIEELRAKRELELMIEDISELLAKELQVSELPEASEPAYERRSFIEKLKEKFKTKTKETASKANVCLSISDWYGKALNASMAEFFIGNKEIKPSRVVAEKAYFYFPQTVVELYVRYLGFVDSYHMIEPDSELKEIQIKMKPNVLINVVDSDGVPLKDAFITIVDEKEEKIEDIYKNTIWKTPFPNNAEDGTAAISINPATLKASVLKIRVVRAGFANKEVVIASSKISTEEQLAKIITLEKIAGVQA